MLKAWLLAGVAIVGAVVTYLLFNSDEKSKPVEGTRVQEGEPVPGKKGDGLSDEDAAPKPKIFVIRPGEEIRFEDEIVIRRDGISVDGSLFASIDEAMEQYEADCAAKPWAFGFFKQGGRKFTLEKSCEKHPVVQVQYWQEKNQPVQEIVSGVYGHFDEASDVRVRIKRSEENQLFLHVHSVSSAKNEDTGLIECSKESSIKIWSPAQSWFEEYVDAPEFDASLFDKPIKADLSCLSKNKKEFWREDL